MNLYIFLLALVLGFIVGLVFGGYQEWSRFYLLTRELQKELISSYEENEELRTIIYKNLGVVLRQTSAHPSLRSSEDR